MTGPKCTATEAMRHAAHAVVVLACFRSIFQKNVFKLPLLDVRVYFSDLFWSLLYIFCIGCLLILLLYTLPFFCHIFFRGKQPETMFASSWSSGIFTSLAKRATRARRKPLRIRTSFLSQAPEVTPGTRKGHGSEPNILPPSVA